MIRKSEIFVLIDTDQNTESEGGLDLGAQMQSAECLNFVDVYQPGDIVHFKSTNVQTLEGQKVISKEHILYYDRDEELILNEGN